MTKKRKQEILDTMEEQFQESAGETVMILLAELETNKEITVKEKNWFHQKFSVTLQA